MTPHQKMGAFAGFLIFLVFDLMLLGAGVRAQDAGLACPDWPLCFGQIVPDLHLKVWLEFLHRVVAGIVFILFVIFMIQIYRRYTKDAFLKFMAALGLLILFAQVIMGGLTVLKLLNAKIVTTHLALATLFLGILYLMKKRIEEHRNGWWQEVSRPQYLLVLPLLFVFAQLLLGGAVASTYAGKVCLDFPKCGGEWIPTLTGQIGLQVIHRLGAYTLFLVSVVLFLVLRFSSWGRQSTGPRVQRLAGVFLALVVVQIIVGVVSLKLLIPFWMSILHLAVALLLFRTTLEIAYWSWRGGEST